jgi:hypothetical protein
MSWYAWATLWWIGVGVALALATQTGAGWRKWWVRVAVLLLSLTTLDRIATDPLAVSELLAAAPSWAQGIAASLGDGCESVGAVAQLACKGSTSGAAPPAESLPRP